MGLDTRSQSQQWRNDPRRSQPAAGTVVNLFPATFSSALVTVGAGRWIDGDAADRLREENPGLRTWRDSQDGSRLYAWFVDGRDDLLPGFRKVSVRIDEAPPLYKRMLTDAVESRFEELGFQRKGNGFVNYAKGSLLAQVPALATTASEPIGVYAKLIPRVHYTWNAEGTLVIGVVMDVLYTTRLDIPVSEWIAAGMQDDIQGAYVVLLPGSPEATQYPVLVGRSIGRIEGIRGNAVLLGDRREPELREAGAAACALEPTRLNLQKYLETRYAKAWENGEKDLKLKIDELVRPRRRHQLAAAAVRRLTEGLGRGLPVFGEMRVTFGPTQKTGGAAFPVRRLQEPSYSFDPVSDRRVSRRVDTGLRDHGPYDLTQAGGRRVRILVVALEENRREVGAMVKKLEHGVSTSKNVFGGLKAMYRLKDLEFIYAFAPTQSNTAPMTRYAVAARDAIQAAVQRAPGQSKFDLVLAVIREQYRDLPDRENPYFQTKAVALILDGVPTQAITIEKLRQPDENLQYILNTMALACYAKLGGTSHVLNVDKSDDGATELVFGIGRASLGEDRHADAREEVIGFATVFRANGQYLYNDCTPYCDRSKYEVVLEQTILRTVNQVAAFENLPDGAPLRLVFHIPRRPGRHEETAVLNAVGKLPRFSVKYALLHVNDDHHFQVFDTANTSGRGWKGDKPAAALMAQRGLCMTFGPDERLLTLVGADQYRGYGSPGPLLLRLDRRSTLQEIDYLTQQLYLLSFMNVGSLNPGVAPATITYAEKLARLTGSLRGTAQWAVELIQQKLGRKLWFV